LNLSISHAESQSSSCIEFQTVGPAAGKSPMAVRVESTARYNEPMSVDYKELVISWAYGLGSIHRKAYTNCVLI